MSVLPAVFGESVVIRILDTVESLRALDQIGLTPRDAELIDGLFDQLETHQVDFTLFFRALAMLLRGEGDGLRAPTVGLVRVLPCDAEPRGWAQSAEPARGDPDELLAWGDDARRPENAWRIDRRAASVVQAGDGGALVASVAIRAADLADRAQLALGRPVEVEWCVQDGRMAIASLRPLRMQATFTSNVFRRLTLVAADEGTVAPLSVDTLDSALAIPGGGADGPTVVRIYARPYRRDVSRRERLVEAAPLGMAAARVATVGAEISAVSLAARRAYFGLTETLETFDASELATLGDDGALQLMHDRRADVMRMLRLLDRTREATRSLFAAFEALVGPLPRECYPALSAPRAVRERVRLHQSLAELAEALERTIGRLDAPTEVERARFPALDERWQAMRAASANVRPLGIDVRPDAIGASDARLIEALRTDVGFDEQARHEARQAALRRIAATAKARPRGRPRVGLARALGVLADQLALAKGTVAEALASTLVRQRRVTLDLGRRLVERAVLELPDDAFYLTLDEVEDGMRGEPGAYTARVRLRREDDARWAAFRAPRLIDPRG